jgi:DNA repair protein RadA/Sms
MGKTINKFVCSQCGYEAPKWLGKCPGCFSWNTLIEEIVEKRASIKTIKRVEAVALNNIAHDAGYRFSSGIKELDRVLGGGIVPGSLIMMGGDPGVGKSTLLLQVADSIAQTGQKVIYLSGEESLKQIKLRSIRLGIESDLIYLLNEQNIDLMSEYIKEINPGVVIIDSIQTVYSHNMDSIPGSLSQLRECTARVMKIAKETEKAFILIGHVTKDGILAGPKVIEHMVDVVVSFEGDKNTSFRILRGIKNRFGATDEIGLLEMSTKGLIEVLNPSSIFISANEANINGTAVAAGFEGSRPLMVEVQALVSLSKPGYARRMASGIDQNRLSLIIAVLEKRAYNLAVNDVYLKITGGVFLRDPSIDLAIAAAIVSSYREYSLPLDTVFAGELSLSGQIRPVPFLDMRLKEAEKLGYNKAVIPANIGNTSVFSSINLIKVSNIDDFIDLIMEG